MVARRRVTMGPGPPRAKIRLPPKKRKAQPEAEADDVDDVADPGDPDPAPSPARRPRPSANVEEPIMSENEENVDVDLKNTEDSLNLLTSFSCNISHVSLLRISANPQDLNRFCREVENSLTENAPSLLERMRQATFQVNAFLLPGIKQSPHDAESLMIEVFRQTTIEEGESDEEERIDRKVIFRCLFTSCQSNGSSLRYVKHDLNSLKNLPVFLWYGKSRVWELLRPILEANLKCNFHPVHFSPVHMQIFTGLWLYQQWKRGTAEKTNDGVCIEYQFPVQRKIRVGKEIPVVSAEINFGEWKDTLADVDDVLDDNHRLKQALMKVWQEAMDSYKNTYKVDLSRAEFLKVRTNSCVISSKGRVKLRKGSKLGEFQPFFTQLTRIVELR